MMAAVIVDAIFSLNPTPAGRLSPEADSLIRSSFLSSSSLRLRFSSMRLGCGARTLTRPPVARQGGRPYRPRPHPSGGGSRRSQGNSGVDASYDPALDLDKIQSDSVRLLDQEQNMVGIVPIDEAIRMADELELILAILSPDADPPVLRLFDSMEYKKRKYEQQKKKKDQQKRSAASRVDIKEVKMGYRIDSHDYSVRLRAAKRFLTDGNKVKVVVELRRAREAEFRNLAIELIKRFQNDIGELATEESKNFSERNIFMVLTPNKPVIQKVLEQTKKKEEVLVEEVSANS